jgi:hypothetical protein
LRDNDAVGYTILQADELEWQPRGENDPRQTAAVSQALTRSRANFFR